MLPIRGFISCIRCTLDRTPQIPGLARGWSAVGLHVRNMPSKSKMFSDHWLAQTWSRIENYSKGSECFLKIQLEAWVASSKLKEGWLYHLGVAESAATRLLRSEMLRNLD